MNDKYPMQPIMNGRFESNPIVDWLCTEVSSMNDIAHYCAENDIAYKYQEQLAQLVGYSVGGYGSLSYVSDESYERAENQMNIDNLETQTPEEKEALDSINSDSPDFDANFERYSQKLEDSIADGSLDRAVKEALDLIDTTPHQYEMSKFSNPKEVEWSDNDELPPLGCEVMTSYTDNGCDDWCDFHGPSKIIAYHGDYVWVAHHGKFNRVHELSSIEFERVNKETPQQREDRERLEAAYDLFSIFKKICGVMEFVDFDKWKDTQPIDSWLAVVDKTNYRKESN